jgi:hypothetical protein
VLDSSGTCEGCGVGEGATVVYCVTITTGGGARGDGETAPGGLADEAMTCWLWTGVVIAPNSEPSDGVGLGI